MAAIWRGRRPGNKQKPARVCHRDRMTLRVPRLAGRLLDLILPPRCALCGTDIADDGALCLDCWRSVTFLGHPLCAVCGDPFEVRPLGDAVCGDCLAYPPRFDRARSAVLYDEVTRPLILAFKHADRLTLAPLLIAWLRSAGAELLDRADLIVPVPLHPGRLLARRYNQAAILAHGLGRSSGLPVADHVLLRSRRTPSQGHLTARQRESNVRGAFALRKDSHLLAEAINGRRVLLVDDVLTTGATVSACTGVLKRGGAAAVDVLTLARVR